MPYFTGLYKRPQHFLHALGIRLRILIRHLKSAIDFPAKRTFEAARDGLHTLDPDQSHSQ